MRRLKLISYLFLIGLFVAGCSDSNEEVVRKDVEVIDETECFIYDQCLLIAINNGYRYTNVIQKFDEETQDYTISITIHKPFKEEQKGE